MIFAPGPFDGTFTIPELYDYNRTHNGEYPHLVYEDLNGVIQTILWKDTVRAVHAAARVVKASIQPNKLVEQREVVGILAYSGGCSRSRNGLC